VTVPVQTPIISYVGNGISTLFAFPFEILQSADLVVLLNGAPQVFASQFSINGIGNASGGSAQFNTPPQAGDKIIIYREISIERDTDYQDNGDLLASTVNADFDRLWMALQDMSGSSTRALQYPVTEYAKSGILPAAASRANMILAFDANGLHTMVPMPASVGAGDLRDEIGSDGKPGLIVGTDVAVGATQIPLSRSPGSKANLWLFFDTENQGGDQIQSVANSILTLTPGVPAGISRVYIRTGTTLSVYNPPPQSVTDATLAPGSAVYNRTHFVVDPRDKGAVGDGVADDTAAWRAAVTAVAANGGGRIVPSPGTYLVSAPIVVTADNVVIDGGDKYAVTVKVPNNATGFTGYNPNAIFILNGNNNVLRNIGIDGNIANNAAQAFGAVSQTVAKSGLCVEDCYIRGVIYNGIILNPLTGTCSNFSIRRNRLENIGWSAISAYCSINGDIEQNSVVSCGGHGILTGYNSNASNFNVALNIRINDNFVTRATPPTHIVGGSAEIGFMIVVGAGDSYITVDSNVCIDNRNAAQDGIGLGQDGVRLNEGLVFSNNVVIYAGLYGIDVSSNHVVVGNYIRYAAQQGIKLGTDVGGNLVNCVVDGNIIDSCNLSTTTITQDGIWVAPTLTVPDPTALYANIKITNNRVVDYSAPQRTKYGLNITFMNNLVYQNCDFSDNDFSGVSTAGVIATGTGIPQQTGWSYANNRHPVQVPQVSGTALNVFGYDKVQVAQAGATTVLNILGGFDGGELSIQHNDANTTYKFNGNAQMYGNGNTNLTPAAGNWVKFERFNGVWAGYRTVQ
jgi:hypothetical protein